VEEFPSYSSVKRRPVGKEVNDFQLTTTGQVVLNLAKRGKEERNVTYWQ